MIHYTLFLAALMLMSVSLVLVMAVVIIFAYPVARLIGLSIWYLYRKLRHEVWHVP